MLTRLTIAALLAASVLALGACTRVEEPTEPAAVVAPPLPRSGAKHGPLRDQVAVPVSGSPFAVAHLVQGGMRADHGSHFGFKVVVDDSAAEPEPGGVLVLVHGSALNAATRRGQIVDRSRVEILGEGSDETLAVSKRAVELDVWGVTETGEASGLGEVEAVACSVSTDLTALRVTVRNEGSEPRQVRSRLVFDCDPHPARERLDAVESGGCPTYAEVLGEGTERRLAVSGAAKVHRRFQLHYAAGASAGTEPLGLDASSPTGGSVSIVARDGQRLFAGETGTFIWLVASGQSDDDAEAVIEAYARRSRSDLRAGLCAAQEALFEGLLAATGEAESARDERLLRLAVDALRHSRYAPRGAMGSQWGAVAAKPVQVRFDGNDLPRIAAGYALLDVDAPISQLGLMARAVRRNRDRLPLRFDENMQALGEGERTAHTVGPWALAEAVAANPGIYTVIEVEPVFDGLRRALGYLEDHRSRDVGFFDADPVEGGWEDSPRFVPLEGGAVEDICDLVRTAWMSRAYLDLAEIAEAMALNADGKALRERGEEIRSDLLEHFLVEEDGLFADRIITDTGAVASDVRSPAGTVPVALHLATKTAAETAAEHILDGNGLWGTWNGSSAYMMAVPSLAYDDRRLNVHEDGHRMRGQVWPWHAYMAWRALVVSGRTGEAERLRDRVLGMLDEHADEGLYEAYDFFDGGPGFGPQGKLEDGSYAPPVIQHAVTAAAVLRLILRR